MRNAVLSGLVLLLAAAGCITVDMGGGSSSKAPKVIKFEASPGSISSGGAAILAWEVENASSVNIDPGIPVAPSTGAEKVTPATTTTYILTASNNFGSTRSTVLLTVGATGGIPQTPAPLTPVINSFSAYPSSITAGNTAVLTWSTTNATGARINGADVAANGSQTVNPSSTITYTLEATNGSSSVSRSAMVVVTSSVTPPPASGSLPTILSFTASPSSVAAGGSTTLTWNTLNATSASIAGFGTVPVSGNLAVNTTGTGSITFSLTATNSAGSTYGSTTITVGSITPPPGTGSRPTAALYASPTSITSGDAATLTWVTSGATSIVIDNGVKSLILGIPAASGSVTVFPTATTTYTLTATNSFGSSFSTQVLVVAAAPPPSGSLPVAALYVSPASIPSGGSATLNWVTSDATSIVIDNGVKSLNLGVPAPSGNVSVFPSATTTYTLTATNSYGSTYSSKVLTVY